MIPSLLRPGGRAAFLEPNPLNPLYYAQIAMTPGMRWKAERGILKMRPDFILAALKSAGMVNLAATRFGFFPPRIVNRPAGARLEGRLERIGFLEPFLPFQLFSGRLPVGR